MTGIKSSLDQIRSVIALVYLLYVANGRKSLVKYCIPNGNKIIIAPNLLKAIENYLGRGNLESTINGNPLITNQYEPLYVGVSLLMKLGYLKMEGKQNTAERTGGVRFPKQLYFANNTFVLDLILKGFSEEVRKTSLYEWLRNTKASDRDFEERVCMFLSTCTIFTQFKLRDNNNNEIFFQTEGIYKVLTQNEEVLFSDSHEFVGPTRIYNNVLKENLEPWIGIKKAVLNLKGKDMPDAKSMCGMFSTTLDIYNVNDDSSQVGNNIEEDYYNEETDSEVAIQNYTYFRPFITAIKSKPFLLLAGISGTGKSRIVRELAHACWEKGTKEYNDPKPRNFEMIQVKPNWHDSSELIGYVSRVSGEPIYVAGDFLKFVAKAWEEPDLPYFLCLDEMNLAPVEQYFAEYLSVIESRKADKDGVILTDPLLKTVSSEWYWNLCRELTSDEDLREQFRDEGISIPQNLIVIGTVNMDETTFSFSRKVLDRAMTIEMNEVDLSGGLYKRHEDIGKLGADELIGTTVEGVDVYNQNKSICDTAINYLEKINKVLEGTSFKIAYRTRNETLLYVVNNLPYRQDEDLDEDEVLKEEYVIARALDEITNMKILSRIEGDEAKVSKAFLEELGKVIKEELKEISSCTFDIEETDDAYKSVSLAKLDEMKKRLDSGYTSFWS